MNEKATKSLQFVLLLASLAGVAVSGLNVYLYSKQAPIVERVSLIERVRAADKEFYDVGLEHITNRLDEINKRFDNIDNKLDKLGGW